MSTYTITYSQTKSASSVKCNFLFATDCYVKTITTTCVNTSTSTTAQQPKIIFNGTTYIGDTALAGGETDEVTFTINANISSGTTATLQVTGTSIYGYVGDYVDGYIKGVTVTSTQCYTITIDGNFNDQWNTLNTIDGYYMPMDSPAPSGSFNGWDADAYPINAWRITDGVNDGYPYVFGFDSAEPVVGNSIYIKTSDGYTPLLAYQKTADGYIPLKVQLT
jgi:hypothetical protein